MTDKPWPTGEVCVVIHPPWMAGRECRIASQDTFPCRRQEGWHEVGAVGLLAQHIEPITLPTNPNAPPGTAWGWPIRWMVPKGVSPDPDELVVCDGDELTHEEIEAFHRIAELVSEEQDG